MKISTLLLATALTLSACVTDDATTSSDDLALEEGPSQCPGGPTWLTERDANGDHVLQLTELPDRARSRLGDADTNGDGALSADEMQVMMQARAEARFDQVDADHDGALAEAEVGDAGRWARISLADGDGDGRVTLAELRQAFADGVVSPPCNARPGPGRRH
jgi:hypothetical protein